MSIDFSKQYASNGKASYTTAGEKVPTASVNATVSVSPEYTRGLVDLAGDLSGSAGMEAMHNLIKDLNEKVEFLSRSANAPFNINQTYYAGDTFTIGGITHIVIPQDESSTVAGTKTRFDRALGSGLDALTITEQNDLNSTNGYNISLTDTTKYKRFRAEAVPLSLYEEGITKPVINGLKLSEVYPEFFANCVNSASATLDLTDKYNLNRKNFITAHLPFLQDGTSTNYKSFDVPQGFGLVNAFNDASIGTKTGGIADDSVADNHLINNITQFSQGQTYIYPTGNNGGKTVVIESPLTHSQAGGNPKLVSKLHDFRIDGKNGVSLYTASANNDYQIFILSAGNQALVELVGISNTYIYGDKFEVRENGGGPINQPATLDTPLTSAGLQLGYYTLLKQL